MRGRRPATLSPRSFHAVIAKAVRAYDPNAPGSSEAQGAPVVQPPYELYGIPVVSPPMAQAPYELDGTPIDPSSQNGSTCVKRCNKKCPQNKCVKARRRSVTFKDDESSTHPETSESEAQTNEGSSKGPSKGKMVAKEANSNKSSDANSTEDESEAQTDEASTSEADASSANDDPNWSISQDCLLRGMKESDPSPPWAEIATALGKTKAEVIARWKQIKDLPTKKEPEVSYPDATTDSEHDTSADADDESESDTDQESDEEEDDEEEVDIEESDENDEEDEDSDQESDVDTDEDEDEDSDSDEDEYQVASPKAKGKSPVHNKWHTGTRNNKIAAENKKAKANAKVKASQQDDQSSSGEDASSESWDVESSSSDSQIIIGGPDKRADMRYLQDHVYKLLYPPEIHPKPDENFCKKDCELLGSIDSKYKKNRWLEMQANFFNVTGRLIPLELIRAKCERAEAERADQEARRAKRATEREKEDRDKVEEWIQDVPEEDDYDDSEEPEEEEESGEDSEEDSEEDSGDSDDSDDSES